jgi:hypothetical protein
MDVNERLLQHLLKKVESFEGPASYVGVSWDHLERYNGYEEPESGFKLTEEDKSLTQIYAGLAVLSRDIQKHLAKSPREDSALLQEVVTSVGAEERKQYGPTAFPYDHKRFPYQHDLARFPQDLAEKAAKGRPTVTGLGSQNICHEWTVKPGKRLFLKFGEKLKAVVCGKGGPYEQFESGLLGQTELPTVIASHILVAGISTATLWYPLAVYVGLLLVRTGLKTYCEPRSRARRAAVRRGK